MNGPQHYKEAERLLDEVDVYGHRVTTSFEQDANIIAFAQVHATLALAAATADQSMARGPGDVGPGWPEVLK